LRDRASRSEEERKERCQAATAVMASHGGVQFFVCA
jgi:hypothetical protein